MAEKNSNKDVDKKAKPVLKTERRLGALFREKKIIDSLAAGFMADKGLKRSDRMTAERFDKELRSWLKQSAGGNP